MVINMTVTKFIFIQQWEHNVCEDAQSAEAMTCFTSCNETDSRWKLQMTLGSPSLTGWKRSAVNGSQKIRRTVSPQFRLQDPQVCLSHDYLQRTRFKIINGNIHVPLCWITVVVDSVNLVTQEFYVVWGSLPLNWGPCHSNTIPQQLDKEAP